MMVTSSRRRWPRVLAVVLVALVAAVFLLLQMLDGILLKKARAEAAVYSEQLGRPITLGGLSTRFLTGFGADVEDVDVGALADEGAPLLHIRRIAVKAPLLGALTSLGKRVEVSSAEIQGLSVNVVRLQDGTTNVERLQKALAEHATPQKEPEPNAKPADLSAVRVDHAALRDGRVSLIDRSSAQPRELSISRVDLVVDDLRAGRPLTVTLKAAVLAAEQNFELVVKTTDLTSSFQAVPVDVSLKVKPIDLSPLGPFLPRNVGLEAGSLDADVSAQLGAAVPGGEGPTRILGTVHGKGLRFAQTQGGQALNLELDTDVSGDAEKGDLVLKKLNFDFGPAGLHGQGSVTGLRSEHPAIQGLEVTGKDLDPTLLAKLYPPLADQLKGQATGPLGLHLHAAGTQTAQNLQLDLDFTPMALDVPKQLTKKAGAPMKLTANIHGAESGGVALRFTSLLDLSGVDLRPGESLNKAPGDTLDLALKGAYRSSGGKGGAPAVTHVDLFELTTHILGDTVTGHGSVEMKGKGKGATTHFELALASPKLDSDRLLIPAPEGAKAKPVKVTPAESYAGLEGHATVQVASLTAKKMELQNVLMDLTLQRDLVTLKTMTFNLYGGNVSASGSSMHLAGEAPPFDIKAKVDGMDAGEALAKDGKKKFLAGKLNCQVDVKGAGTQKAQLAQALAGAIEGSLADGAFLGTDLFSSVAAPLGKALPFASKSLASGGATSLGKTLPFGLQISNGVAQLKRPITVTRPEGSLNLGGGIGLDGLLNLAGTVELPPAAIHALTGGKVTPPSGIPLALKVTGPAWAPTVTDVDVKPAVATLLKLAASQGITKLLGAKGQALQNVLQGGGAQKSAQETVDAQKANAEKQAADEKAKAEQRARDEADRLKKQAGDQFKGIFGR